MGRKKTKDILDYLYRKNAERKYCSKVEHRHAVIFKMVDKILFQFDPIFIKEILKLGYADYESIRDEYYGEAAKIALNIDAWGNIENFIDLVEYVFSGFGCSENTPREFCILAAQAIWSDWKRLQGEPNTFHAENVMMTRVRSSYKPVIVVD